MTPYGFSLSAIADVALRKSPVRSIAELYVPRQLYFGLIIMASIPTEATRNKVAFILFKDSK
jgi:hypothetical protein